MHFAHIGDTRIYHLSKDGTLTQLTDDDTHVGWLRRTGQISELEARMHPAKNRLQKALGAGNQFVNPQVREISCSSGVAAFVKRRLNCCTSSEAGVT